jgi:tetratricopeptide (TPR) repeat protein
MYFTYCKTYIAAVLVLGVFIFSGWNWKFKKETRSEIKVPVISALDQARLAYENGEYYSARVQVQKILARDPENTSAQQLMGDVLDKEIARQKEAVLASSPSGAHDDSDEKAGDVNKIEIKNWIERSKTLQHQGQYDLALFAAEKVFVYDADNHEASLLIDDIKEEAVKNGKAESLFLSKMYKEEIGERVKKYRSEAQDLIHDDKSEQAKFTLQKILLLEPEDPEALKLFRDLQKKEAHA